MSEKQILIVDNYDYIDGRSACKSNNKKLTIGAPTLEENKNMEIALQLWKENNNGELTMDIELPIHQVMDMMIFLSRTLLYFKEAYRMPLLYNPDNPIIDRVGIQGSVMPIRVVTENENINEDIKKFMQSINNLGEITGSDYEFLIES